MERYLGEGDLINDELNAALPKAISGGCLVPILCTAAKKTSRAGTARRALRATRWTPRKSSTAAA